MRSKLFLVIVPLALFVWAPDVAGKPPGGGGGGGGGADPDSTLYYVDAGSGSFRSIHPDGTGDTALSVNGVPSYAVHNGARWFVRLRSSGVNNPDGFAAQDVVVETASGSVTIVTGSESLRHAKPRWARDDSFVSYFVIEWTGPGASDAEARLVRVDVTWGSDGVPGFGEEEFVMDVGLDPVRYWNPAPNVGEMEWAPIGAGDKFVFDDQPNSNLSKIHVRDVGAATTAQLVGGFDPQWSPDGARIAFHRDFSIRTITPSGSGEAVVQAKSKKNGAFSIPKWSADGAHIACNSDGLVYFPSGGGSKTRVTSNANHRIVAWR